MDLSDNRKISYLNASFNTGVTNQYLRRDGTWATPSNTCLIEGTKILMSDGSEKNIEDVKVGDSIMSYNPNTNQNFESIVVLNQVNGEAENFTNYYFDDSSFVTVYGAHCFYHKDIGTAVPVKDWELGDTGHHYENGDITFIGTEEITHAGYKNYYWLLSSGMTYYANGILQAQSLTKGYATLKYEDLPESYINALKANYDSSAGLHTYQRDKEYGKKVVPMLKELRRQEGILSENKKLLADTDYVVAKFTEGLISAADWLKSKTQRAGWRANVNEAEVAYDSIKSQYDDFKNKYKATSTRRERFNDAVTRCSACTEDLKEYYANRGK